MALRTHSETIKQGYINACNAVLNRGGEIETGAGITSLPDAIRNIPHDTVLAYQLVDSNAYRSIVPQNAEPYARVNKIGGKSYKTRNLIPFPYYTGSKTAKGVTITMNDDRSITLNGTATEDGGYFFAMDESIPLHGTYTLSGISGGSSSTYYLQPYIDNKDQFLAINTKTYNFDGNLTRLPLFFKTGTVFDNLVIKPMLNEGDTALPYEPFFEGLRDTKVTALESEGANLLPFPYDETTKTSAGITFTVNGNRSITINGSNDGTANSFIYLVWRKSFKAGDYCLSIKDVNGLGAILYDRTSYLNIKNTVVTLSQDVDEVNIYLQIIKGTTSVFDNETVYPMLAHTPMEYKPYVGTIDTLAIPEEIQALEGYGKGVRSSIFNYIDYERKVFVRRVKTLVLNGTENWTADQTWNGASYLNKARFSEFAEDKAVNAAICSHYNNAAGSIYDCVQGVTLWDNYLGIYDEIYNTENVTAWKEHLAELYAAGNPITITYALETPIETDISEYLADKFIEVEGGGTITAVNEHEEGVPTSATYLIETVGGAI